MQELFLSFHAVGLQVLPEIAICCYGVASQLGETKKMQKHDGV